MNLTSNQTRMRFFWKNFGVSDLNQSNKKKVSEANGINQRQNRLFKAVRKWKCLWNRKKHLDFP
jgi:hypothetical protein